MRTTKAIATHCEAERLAGIGAVKANVLGILSIVVAQAWQPITDADSSTKSYSVLATEAHSTFYSFETEGTPCVDSETQKLIDGLQWEQWK